MGNTLFLKNSPKNFVIGNSLLSYPVKIVLSKKDVPKYTEWEKECISYLVKIYDYTLFTIYENITFGGYIITDVTHDKKIIALTYIDLTDLDKNIKRVTFSINNETYTFDGFLGLSKVIWNFKSLTERT